MVDFRIRVIVDTSGAQRAGKRVEGALARSTVAAERLRASLGRAFGLLGGGLILRSVIRTLAQFDQALATVRAVSGATEAQFKALREEAQRLGRETRFSATQAAEGLVLLSRAGFSAEDSLDTLDDTLLLAQAGALDLATAAGITTATLRGFRLETDQASRVTDVLALAANSANTNVGQLGQAIKFVAPVAAGLGLSLEATTAALQELSDAGLQGTLAGTGLRRVLAELEAPGTKLRAVLQRAGKAAKDIAPSQVGLTRALRELEAAGVDTGEALEIFGQRGGPAFEVLSASIGDIEANTAALEGASGTARRLAAIQDDNLLGALLRVRSAFKGVILEFGQAERAGGPLRDAIESLARALLFLADNIQIVINLAEALAVVIGIKLVKAFVRLTIAIATNPIGLFVTALSLGIAALVGFADEILATGDGITTLADVASTAFRAIQQTVGPVLAELATSLRAVFGEDLRFSLRQFIEETASAFDTLAGIAGGVISLMRDLFVVQLGNVFTASVKRIESFGLRAKKLFFDLANGIAGFFTAPAVTIAKSIQLILNSIAGLAAAAASLRLISEESRQGAEKAVAGIEAAINTLQARKIKPLFDTKETQAQIDALDKESNDLFSKIGASLSNSFKTGFNQDNFLGFVRSVFDQAEEEARASRAAAAATPGADAGTPGRGGPAGAGPGGLGDVDEAITAFDKLLQAQKSEAFLLETIIPLRGAAAQAQRLNIESGLDLTEVELKRLEAQLASNEALRTRLNLLNEIFGPQEEFAKQVGQLAQLFADSEISADQFNKKLLELKIASLEASNDLGDGFTRAFLKIEQEANDLASVGEKIVNVFADSAVEAITKFAETGKFEFREFANSILDELKRILIRLLVIQALNAILPGSGTVAGALPVPGRQAGGPVDPNRPFLVGEQGPELFRPQGSGSIVPANETAAMMASAGQAAMAPTIVEVAAPAVNVNITNQNDPNEFKDAIDSGDLDIAIVNVNQRRKSAVRQSLGV